MSCKDNKDKLVTLKVETSRKVNLLLHSEVTGSCLRVVIEKDCGCRRRSFWARIDVLVSNVGIYPFDGIFYIAQGVVSLPDMIT